MSIILFCSLAVIVAIVVAYKINQAETELEDSPQLDYFHETRDNFSNNKPYIEVKGVKDITPLDLIMAFWGIVSLIVAIYLIYLALTVAFEPNDLAFEKKTTGNALMLAIYAGFFLCISFFFIYRTFFKKEYAPVLTFTDKGLIYNYFYGKRLIKVLPVYWANITEVDFTDWNEIDILYKEDIISHKLIPYNRISCSRDDLISIFRQYGVNTRNSRP